MLATGLAPTELVPSLARRPHHDVILTPRGLSRSQTRRGPPGLLPALASSNGRVVDTLSLFKP